MKSSLEQQCLCESSGDRGWKWFRPLSLHVLSRPPSRCSDFLPQSKYMHLRDRWTLGANLCLNDCLPVCPPPQYQTHLEMKDLKVHARVLATVLRLMHCWLRTPSITRMCYGVSLLHIVGVQAPQQTCKTAAAARSVFTCCQVLKIQSLCQSPCNQRQHHLVPPP